MKRNRYAVLALSLLLLAGCTKAPAEVTPTPEPVTSQPISSEPNGEETPTPTPDSSAEVIPENAVRLWLTKDTAALGAVKLAMDGKENGTYYTHLVDVDGAAEALVDGLCDAAVLPAGLAAQLYNRDVGVELLALTGRGGLAVYNRGQNVQSLWDLDGPIFHACGEGSDAQYILTAVLEANDIDLKDLNVEWHSSYEELTERVVQKDADCALLTDLSYVTALKSGARVAVDLDSEWTSAGLGELPYTGCLVARTDWAKENPDKLSALLEDYRASVQYAKDEDYRAELAKAAETLGVCDEATAVSVLGQSAYGAETGALDYVPSAEVVFITGDDMLGEVQSYYQTLYAVEPKAIGGSIPDDAFYYFE